MIVRHGEFASRIEGAGLTRFMGTLNEYLGFVEKVDKRIRNEKLTELLARAEPVSYTHLVRANREDLRSKMTWHPILKAANCHEMLLSIGVHCLRHVKQIEEIKAELA